MMIVQNPEVPLSVFLGWNFVFLLIFLSLYMFRYSNQMIVKHKLSKEDLKEMNSNKAVYAYIIYVTVWSLIVLILQDHIIIAANSMIIITCILYHLYVVRLVHKVEKNRKLEQ